MPPQFVCLVWSVVTFRPPPAPRSANTEKTPVEFFALCLTCGADYSMLRTVF